MKKKMNFCCPSEYFYLRIIKKLKKFKRIEFKKIKDILLMENGIVDLQGIIYVLQLLFFNKLIIYQ